MWGFSATSSPPETAQPLEKAMFVKKWRDFQGASLPDEEIGWNWKFSWLPAESFRLTQIDLWKWREFHGFMGWLSGLFFLKSNLEDFTRFWECSSLPPMKHTPFCPKKSPKKSAVSSLAPSMVAGAEATDGASAFQAVPRRFGWPPGTPGTPEKRGREVQSYPMLLMYTWYIDELSIYLTFPMDPNTVSEGT